MERKVSSAVVQNLRKGQKELFSNGWDTCGCLLESDEKHPSAFGDPSSFCRAPESAIFFYPWVTCHIHEMRTLHSACSREASVELYPPEQGLGISRKKKNQKPALTLFYQNAASPTRQALPFHWCSGPGDTELGKNMAPLGG